MSTPFKMKGFSGFGNSPLKQNGDKLGKAKGEKKATKDTRTPSQKARDKRDLERQTRIYHAQEKTRKYHREREKKELEEKGYYTDATTGKRYTPAEQEMGGGKKRKYFKEVRD